MWTHLFIRCIFGCYLYAWHCAKNCGGSPRKTQHGLLGFPNLIEMKQCSLQHSTELCYTLHRQCGSQSDTLGCENSRGQTLESSRREGHCKPVGCWSHPYTHYLTGGPVILHPAPALLSLLCPRWLCLQPLWVCCASFLRLLLFSCPFQPT